MRFDIIINKLTTQPKHFTFTQAYKILDCFYKEKDQKEKKVNINTNKKIKLISYLNLSVPQNDCIDLNIDKRILTINGLSLLGVNGVLPKNYSEQAFLNKKNHKNAFVDFINIFENRYFFLKYTVEESYEQTLQKTPDFNQNYKITGIYKTKFQDILSPFFALLLNKNKTINDLSCLISNLIKTEVKIHQFQEKWYKIPRYCRFILDYSPLINKALGEKTKNIQSAILIELFFETYEQYMLYFNNNEQKILLKQVIKYYLNNKIKFKINIKIKEFITNTIKLDQNNKLGDTTWL